VSHVPPISIVEAVLVRGQSSWVWVVPRCPYCGRPHAHYGGPLETDPSRYLNHPVTPSCNADTQSRSAPDTPATALQYILRVKEPSYHS
jgi:hypothetical protein